MGKIIMISMINIPKGKILICFVTIVLMLSYIPLMVNSSTSGQLPLPSGNLYIPGGTTFVINENTIDPLTGQAGQYGMSGSLYVNSSGTLIIDNATLYFKQDALHHYRMFVNGTLIMYNAVLKDTWDALLPYLHLNVSFYRATLETQKSVFMFPGNVYFDGSTIIMRNTVFNGYTNLNPILNEFNANSSSPTPYFFDSTGYMDNVSFKDMFQPNLITPELIANNSSGRTNVNISGSQTYTSYSTISNLKYSPSLKVSEVSLLGKYRSGGNASIYLYDGSTNISTFKLNTTRGNLSTLDLNASGLRNISLGQLYGDKLYAILKDSPSGRYFNLTRLNFLVYTNDSVNFFGPTNFNFSLVNSQIYGRDVFIDASFNNSHSSYYELNPLKNTISLADSSSLYVANLTVDSKTLNNNTRINGTPPFSVDSSSFVYLYRFADINISTSQGFPVNGVYINMAENWPGSYLNAQQYDHYASYYNNLLQTTLVSYSMLPSDYNLTAQGKAAIPVLTDVFNGSTNPNTRVFGHYTIKINGGLTSNVTLDSFPNMTANSNYANVTMTYTAPFVYYSLSSYTPFVNGNMVTIRLNATSYLNSVTGTFIVLSDGVEIGNSQSMALGANTTTPVSIQFADSLSTGTHQITVEFTSSQLYSSSAPVLVNVTSYSNVALGAKAVLTPEYQQGGSLISGYGGNILIKVTNFGGQNSGVTKVFVNYTFPSGGTQSSSFLDIISGNSTVSTTLPLPIINAPVAGYLGVKVTALTSAGVIPYSTSNAVYNLSYPVIPTPSVSVTSINFNSSYYNGLKATGTVSLTSNELVDNVTVDVVAGKNITTYLLPSINGFYNLPISIPSSYLKVGRNNISVTISNTTKPYLLGTHEMNGKITVNPNYGFQIISPQLLLTGNITSLVNGTLSFEVRNVGNNSTSTIPVEILEDGVPIAFTNVTAPSFTQLVPISVEYSPSMVLQIIANYNSQYPSSYNYYPFMYYNQTIDIPYFFVSYSLPSQIVNGSTISGSIYINNVANYNSNDTVMSLLLGNTLIYSKNMGNLQTGFSGTIPIFFNTSSTPKIMNGLLTNSYQERLFIRNSVTGSSGILINLGSISINEKPNFIVNNVVATSDGHNITTIYAGEKFKVSFNVTNNGGTTSTGAIYYKILVAGTSSQMLLYHGSINSQIYPSQTVFVQSNNITTNSTMTGVFEVFFNYNNTINTELKNTQNVSVPISILNPRVIFIVTPTAKTVVSGNEEILNIRAINSNTSLGWQTNITVIVMQGSKVIERQIGQTNSQGFYSTSFRVVNTGSYTVEIVYQGPQGVTTQSNPGVFSVKAAPLVIPIFVYPIIVVAVLAVGFVYGFNYLKKKNVGLVQCSVCGALLPEGATKCPRCGTEFEKDRVKCSECDSWIPEDSKFCPNCGSVFIGREDPGYSGLVKLKAEYDKFLDTYRQKAKAVLGEKINELEFQTWWRNGPEYKAFRQWITEKGLSPEDLEKTDSKSEAGNVDLKVEKKKKGLFRRK